MKRDKVIYRNGSLQLPRDIINGMQLSNGDVLEIRKTRSGIQLKKAKVHNHQYKMMQLLTCLLTKHAVIGIMKLRKSSSKSVVEWLSHMNIQSVTLNDDGRASLAAELQNQQIEMLSGQPVDLLLSGGHGMQRERLQHYNNEWTHARKGAVVVHSEHMAENLTVQRFVESTGIQPHYLVVVREDMFKEVYHVVKENERLTARLIAN